MSLLAVGIAAPVTTLLLAATDGMSATVAAASGGAATRFLTQLGTVTSGLSLLAQSPFVTFFVGLMLVGAAILLWVEMLMREAAIYIVVLMLPLVFAGFVWPARRTWAIRSVELLVALILAKFAVVCVLALGGEALGHAGSGAGGMLVGLVLVLLSVGAPWAVLRLLPMAEIAAGAAAHLSAELPGRRQAQMLADVGIESAAEWVSSLPARLERQRAGAEDAPLAGDTAQAGRATLAAIGGNRPGAGQSSSNRGAASESDADVPIERAGPELAASGPEAPTSQPGSVEPGATHEPTPAPPEDPPERPVFDGWSPVLLGAEMAEEGFGGRHPLANPEPDEPEPDEPTWPPFHRLDGEL